MTSVLSYKNLIDLAEYINSPTPDADTYPYEYANRQPYSDDNYSTIGLDDVEALLSNLVGDVTFDWVGKNCEYNMVNPNCTENAGQLVRKLNIDNTKNYSKCYYIPSDYGSDSVPPNKYRIKKSGANTLDCPNLESCGSNLSYIWNMKPTTSYEQKLANYIGGDLNSIFKPYSIEGNCQEVYGNNGVDNVTTNINDPYIKIEGGSSVETNDGKYECMNRWTPIKDANRNNVETVVGEEISTDSSASDLAQKCARTGIYYGGNYDNGEYVIGEGGGFLLPGSGIRDGAKSAPCIINATDALYVKKGDRNVLCDDTEPLYPGDDYEAEYDLPLNTPNREEWWDNNSCVWKNVILDNYNSSIRGGNPTYTNYDDLGGENANTFFTPKKLNGKCDYLTAENVFTSKDDNGSATSIGEYCSGSGAGRDTDFCKTSQYRNSLIGEIDYKKYAEFLHPESKAEQAVWLNSLSQDRYPGLTHPGNNNRNSNSDIRRFDEAYYYGSADSPIREKCPNYIHRYQWVDENTNIGSNMSSKTQEDLADMSIDSNDINGKFMKFTKSNTINRKYKTPCYVEENSSNGTGTTKYLLPYNREYRAVNEDYGEDPTGLFTVKRDNPEDTTVNVRGITPQHLTFTNTSYNSNFTIDNEKAWLSNSEVKTLERDGTYISREGSDGIDIIKWPYTSTSPIPSHQEQGIGSGECLGIVQVDTRPQYKNEDNLYNPSDTTTKTFFDSLESVDNIDTSTLKIKSIKESIAENVGLNDYLYYNIGRGDGGTKECPDPEDALSQLTYTWLEEDS